MKKFYLLFIILIIFWLTGSLVDTALWGHGHYNSPSWIIDNLEIFWLVLNQFLLPFMIVLVLRPSWSFFWFFIGTALYGSVVWDIAYSFLTRGSLISDSLTRWFSLGDFVISIAPKYVLTFHLLRIIAGTIILLFVCRKIKGEFARENEQ